MFKKFIVFGAEAAQVQILKVWGYYYYYYYNINGQDMLQKEEINLKQESCSDGDVHEEQQLGFESRGREEGVRGAAQERRPIRGQVQGSVLGGNAVRLAEVYTSVGCVLG